MAKGVNQAGPRAHMASIRSGKALTGELRRLAAEAHTITDAGDVITREEALAALVWQQALGWTEKVRSPDGNLVEILHPPVAWAQQFLWERIEGKAAPALAEEQGSIRASDKVRDLARQRLNELIPSGPKSGPPSHKSGQ